MSVMPVMPREPGEPGEPGEWTVDDLASLPDDGRQYELLDGILLVSPGPLMIHQIIASELHFALKQACPPDLLVLFAPFDWRPDPRTSLQPDLIVLKNENRDQASTKSLLLAVEILSPSTRSKDLVWKRNKYESAGVPSFWIVDPQAPSITALELVDGRYSVVGDVKADEPLAISRPFELTLTPSALLA